jgi:hypothetical protein
VCGAASTPPELVCATATTHGPNLPRPPCFSILLCRQWQRNRPLPCDVPLPRLPACTPHLPDVCQQQISRVVYRCHPFGLATFQADSRGFAASRRSARSCQELSAMDYRKWKLWGKRAGRYAAGCAAHTAAFEACESMLPGPLAPGSFVRRARSDRAPLAPQSHCHGSAPFQAGMILSVQDPNRKDRYRAAPASASPLGRSYKRPRTVHTSRSHNR